jgi:hypothetical protein
MKKLLLFLIISTIAYGIVEESNEYDDISLEINLKPLTKAVPKVAKPVRQVVNKVAKPARQAVTRVAKPVRQVVNKVAKPVQQVVNKVTKPVQQVVNKVTKPVQQVANKVTKPVQQVVNRVTKPISSTVVKKVIKPSINTINKYKATIKKLVEPTIKKINNFLKAHPKIKKITDPLINEIKKAAKDPHKTIGEILKDPKNAQKIVEKALKPIIDKVKAFHPFEKIKGELKKLENFMEKKHIPVKELKKLFVDTPAKALNKLSQKARNGIYWLKKNGYWEPIKLVGEVAGQYAATALCSAYLTPAVCEPAMDLLFTFVVDKYLDSL